MRRIGGGVLITCGIAGLAIVTTFILAWLLPFAAIQAGGTRWDIAGWAVNPVTSGPELWWADSRPEWPVPRAGHYFHYRHPLLTSIDMRRIVFEGALEEKPYFRQNPPPPWAATISIDFREGFDQVTTTATGWPFRCFRGEHWINWRAAADRNPTPIIVIPGLKLPTNAELHPGLWTFTHHGTMESAIPHQPIWPGFVVNIAVFSGAWLLLLYTPGVARRGLRRRRGRCPGCNYDLRATPRSSPCPECGAQVPIS